ncbi:4-alpha-glucanotransferase [Rubripirellula lacrimiformis]|uniref:4-alpha-glucanotransferase n=1 Tax=Rubripirellula lacrimiformis TaxID=1930273 RepID=A0A517NIB9_9BACT|nr:4-alpha-glucanotransferase [Rubripirellula lacrimiformis]QDT06803.1 4-alpha-glucanotransferase [Rubripirellula lacrimiformis]
MRFQRSSGVLCHITSLAGDYGIGDLGPNAFAFVDFLQAAGQGIWQILPLVPPSACDSPYSGYSAFAGNPLMISPELLVQDGLLDADDIQPSESVSADSSKVDYAAVAEFKQAILRKAFDRFTSGNYPQIQASLDQFVAGASWLDEFARFEAMMRHFGNSDWTQWPIEIVRRFSDAIENWDQKLRDEIDFSEFQQFIFDRQWKRLKAYANDRGIQMYGDMPIFVAHNSADVWANQDLFALDMFGKPTLVAGVPPDYFSKTGQLWGNPQYRWDVLESTDYAWWTARFRGALQQFDLLRVDHFRGFEAYWEVPASAKTAVSGRWVIGPGAKPFQAARRKLGELPMIAEDLGMITEAVHQLRDELGFPGMRVFQFGFDTEEDDFHRPRSYTERSVAYTGTHDNDTLVGWYRSRKPRADAPDPLDEIVTGGDDVHWQMIDAVYQSASDTAIVPIQDFLGLGNEAKMNMPGKADGNWAWRLTPGMITDDLADRIREMTQSSNRMASSDRLVKEPA